MTFTPIDTTKFSHQLREKAIDIANKSILITNFFGSEQEKDLSEPANCKGFGRVPPFELDAERMGLETLYQFFCSQSTWSGADSY